MASLIDNSLCPLITDLKSESISPFSFNIVTNNADLRQYRDANIAEASRWDIRESFYKEQIDECDIGIFITYMPSNFNEIQIAGFLLGTIKENDICVELICARKYEGKTASFGQIMMCMIYNVFTPNKIVINGVNNDNVSYYEHYGYVTQSICAYGHIMTIPLHITINDFFHNLSIYVESKHYKFLNSLTHQDLECA